MKRSRLLGHLALVGILILAFLLVSGENYLCSCDDGNDFSEAFGLQLYDSPTKGQIHRNASSNDSIAAAPSSLMNDSDLDKQWALQLIDLPEVWRLTTGDSAATVAILDTGIDQDHQDLSGKVIQEINFSSSPTPIDVRGHGTHVSGIISANIDNKEGIAGVSPGSRLLNVKVVDDNGRTYADTVAEGIIWATDHGANVINISIEFKEPSSELEAAINYAWNKGTVIVAAAGNESTGLPIYPAFYANCIAVTSCTNKDTLAPLSNYGEWVDVAAPGMNIYSTLPDNIYGYKSGTSFATAYVSGLAALLFGAAKDQNGDGRLNDEVRQAVESGCVGTGINTGYGRIDALRSYEIATER